MSTIATSEGLRLIREHGAAENWLAVLVTMRGDRTPSVSLVNAGVLPHPVTGEPVVAFVARGHTAKLANLRRNPSATLVFRSGWEWVSVRGPAEMIGPDDLDGTDDQIRRDSDAAVAVDVRRLLRDIYLAAGGEHPDLDKYDAVMAAERRTAVLITPDHFATNPAGTEHQEP